MLPVNKHTIFFSKRYCSMVHNQTFYKSTNIINLRNSDFNNCKFLNLKLINNPNPNHDEKEGYIVTEGRISIPMMTEDPNNAYSSICSGYYKLPKTKISFYDEKLHVSHRKFKSNEHYEEANIFDNTIYSVNFNMSNIIDSEINKTKFDYVKFHDTTIDNISFNETLFSKTNFRDCIVKNSKFVNNRFDFEFKCTIRNTIFRDIHFENCSLQGCLFYRCHFIGCTFNDVTFYRCLLGAKFFDCNFKSIKLQFSYTDGDKFSFDMDNFKLLCNNKCIFE